MTRLVLMLLVLWPATAVAQEESRMETGVQRTLEMPAHRSLQSVIADPDTTLAPFETDGCSGGMSWSWGVFAEIFPNFAAAQGAAPPWEACCVVHDKVYHNAAGATDAEQSFAARLAADEALRQCVAEPVSADVQRFAEAYDVSQDMIRSAYGLVAQSMFNAVRLGGGPCSGLPWRWGFGYPGCVPGF